jgi:hypothetical protein
LQVHYNLEQTKHKLALLFFSFTNTSSKQQNHQLALINPFLQTHLASKPGRVGSSNYIEQLAAMNL